jgi:hypothetical protein
MKIRYLFGALALGSVLVLGMPSTSGAATSGVERFTIVEPSQTGPGTILAHGVFDAGGLLYNLGNKAGEAVFPSGGFRIFHGGVRTAVTVNAKTCTGKITGSGPYRLLAGFGSYAHIKGTGTAHLSGRLETARNPNGTCNFRDISAFEFTVHARGPVSF